MTPPHVVIDLRCAHEFSEGHLEEASHFAGLHGDHGLLSRLAELPESRLRAKLIAYVVAEEGDAQSAVTAVRGLGFPDAQIRSITPTDTLLRAHTSQRLWSPSPLVVRATALADEGAASTLDIGCGGGRDSAWLVGRGWDVHAVDRCAKLLRRTELLSTRLYTSDTDVRKRGSVTTHIRTFGADNADDAEWLRAHAAQLVLVVRFLRRPLLSMLGCAVLPGGLLAYEHFLDGCEEFGAPKKKSQMLRYGELAKLYGPHSDFDILLDQVDRLPDGRPVNRFIARKRR